MDSVAVEARARAILMRPLPVWIWVPAGSAGLAMRKTMTPFGSAGLTAFMNAAKPATWAAAAEEPLITAEASPGLVGWMSVPGAAMKTASPSLLKDARASFGSVAATPITPRSPAGKAGALEALLPAAATSTTPRDHA